MNSSSALSTTTNTIAVKIASTVRVVDPLGVGRMRRHGRETSVARVGDASRRQRDAESHHQDEELAPHERWHPTRMEANSASSCP